MDFISLHFSKNFNSLLTKNADGLLTSNALTGVALTLFLFLFCFIVVHFLLLAKIGWQASLNAEKTKTEEQKQETPAPKNKEREPIYYIVEKKRAKPKARTIYSEPKEFRFKSD